MPSSPMPRSTIPIWPLPLAIAVTLTVAAHLALVLSIQAGHVPAYVPYLEGCTSISRAARHGLGNHLFRLLVLPCSVLVGMHWWLSSRWLRLHGVRSRSLMFAGVIAAIALAVYATFLGSDGEVYRFLRRHGVVGFFGASYLAQLVFLRLSARAGALDRRTHRAMQATCMAMLVIGLVHVAAMASIAGSSLQDRLENALEWQLGVLLAAWFVLQAWAWRATGYVMEANEMRPP